jgi:hypothetical protein
MVLQIAFYGSLLNAIVQANHHFHLSTLERKFSDPVDDRS